LKRHGCFDSRRRIRYKSPPRGWYLPDVGVLATIYVTHSHSLKTLKYKGFYGLLTLFLSGVEL
jgi:hypothetical protein